MFLALIFLPVALVVITIGLPVLILLASIGVMCVVAYGNIYTKLSGYTMTSQSSMVTIPHESTSLFNNIERQYYSRPSSPLPSLPEYLTSISSMSHLGFRYKSNIEAPPSPTSSMQDISMNRRHQEYDGDSSNRRRKVRFA